MSFGETFSLGIESRGVDGFFREDREGIEGLDKKMGANF
jgi:hypothetical protein